MVSTQLQKARDFEAQYGPHIPETERPAFHATPPIGWMNVFFWQSSVDSYVVG